MNVYGESWSIHASNFDWWRVVLVDSRGVTEWRFIIESAARNFLHKAVLKYINPEYPPLLTKVFSPAEWAADKNEQR